MTAAFGERLGEAFDRYGQLCVGIDPHDYLLDAWGLPRTAAGLAEFGHRVIEAAAGRVGIVKPQVAFFEAYGAEGFRALEGLLRDARQAGLLVIADAKRGDIGTSVDAYANAWLSPGAPLEADAVTVTAYTGTGSLEGVFQRAEGAGKGVFVLSATSNPESAPVQTALVGDGQFSGRTVAGLIAAEAVTRNARSAGIPRPFMGSSERSSVIGSIGVVLGATKNLSDYGVDAASLGRSVPSLPVLAPGFGHQGAMFSDIRHIFSGLATSTIVSVSRSVLAAGPGDLKDAITEQSDQLRRDLR